MSQSIWWPDAVFSVTRDPRFLSPRDFAFLLVWDFWKHILLTAVAWKWQTSLLLTVHWWERVPWHPLDTRGPREYSRVSWSLPLPTELCCVRTPRHRGGQPAVCHGWWECQGQRNLYHSLMLFASVILNNWRFFYLEKSKGKTWECSTLLNLWSVRTLWISIKVRKFSILFFYRMYQPGNLKTNHKSGC